MVRYSRLLSRQPTKYRGRREGVVGIYLVNQDIGGLVLRASNGQTLPVEGKGSGLTVFDASSRGGMA
jgi:hypothetical protein